MRDNLGIPALQLLQIDGFGRLQGPQQKRLSFSLDVQSGM
jgi:hypothetical protein